MKNKYLLLAIFSLLGLIGCTNQDTLQEEEKEFEKKIAGLTSFVLEDAEIESAVVPSVSSAKGSSSRTILQYDGTKLIPYWTIGDKIFLKDGYTWKKNTESDIDKQLSGKIDKKTPTAKFYFAGEYKELSYPIHYTNTDKAEEVKIAHEQRQEKPNDASHLGKDGDCGVATARRDGEKYKFRLEHRSAYVTFIPYFSKANLSTVRIKRITLGANANSYNSALAGIFSFKEKDLKVGSLKLQEVGLTLGTEGFELPMQSDKSKNAAFMVVCPGTYPKLTVTYTLEDKYTGAVGNVVMNYKNVDLIPGRNQIISQDLNILDYTKWSEKIYQWDATSPYLKGQESRDVYTNGKKALEAVEAGSRASVETTSPTTFLNLGKHSCSHSKGIPNLYEMSWYIARGDIHFDDKICWVYHNHLYNSGVYILKKEEIRQQSGDFSDSKLCPDIDKKYTSINITANYYKKVPKRGRPQTNIGKYFFLPSLGGYCTKEHGPERERNVEGLGKEVWYWSSSGYNNTKPDAQPTAVAAGVFVVRNYEIVLWCSSYRDWGYPVVPFK